jgi:hypothetical protein
MNKNKIEERRHKAEKKWIQLQNNKRPLIYVGAGSCGLAAGAAEVITAIESYLQNKSIAAELMRVGCIGPCYLEPLVDIQMPGQPRISYSNMSPATINHLLGFVF